MFLVMTTLAVPPNLVKAERYLRRGRLTLALRALGPQCPEPEERVACEFLRARIHVAMGHDFRARVAIHRIFEHDPTFSVGERALPKIRYLVDSIRSDIARLSQLELERLGLGAWGGATTVRVSAPVVHDLQGIAAHVRLPGERGFTRIELTREGNAFVGSFQADLAHVEALQYYLVAELATGPAIASGSRDEPRAMPVDAFVADDDVVATAPPSPDGPGGKAEEAGMQPLSAVEETTDDASRAPSSWPVWLIAGASAAVVVLGVVSAARVANNAGDSGDVAVHVRFVD